MFQKIINNKELSMFLILLAILFILTIIFRLDIIWGIQSTITFFAVIVALGTAILSVLHNKQILKQSEINLNIQLRHKVRNEALIELYNILNDDTGDFYDIQIIMKSPKSFYLPNNTQNLINKIFSDLAKIGPGKDHLCTSEGGLEPEKNFDYDKWQHTLKISKEDLLQNVINNLK